MKRALLLSVGGILIVFASLCAQAPQSNSGSNPAPAQGVAVVELFTSQGCNSCPPADRVLMVLSKQSREQDLAIYCLSFHVDYWNRLGWADPYSQTEFSQRQRAYAQASGKGQVYTPQMIVNGEHEFVGSKAELAVKHITEDLRRPPQAIVELEANVEEGLRRVRVSYRVKGAAENGLLNIALVQDRVSNEVPRGENEGKTLSHANVVRTLETIDLASRSEGHITLEFPKNISPRNLQVIAYAQDKTSLRINGASRVALGDAEAKQIEPGRSGR